MNGYKLFKMLLKHNDWRLVTPHPEDETISHVVHKSGVYFYGDCHGIPSLYQEDIRGIIFDVNIIWFFFCHLPRYRLEKKLGVKTR